MFPNFLADSPLSYTCQADPSCVQPSVEQLTAVQAPFRVLSTTSYILYLSTSRRASPLQRPPQDPTRHLQSHLRRQQMEAPGSATASSTQSQTHGHRLARAICLTKSARMCSAQSSSARRGRLRACASSASSLKPALSKALCASDGSAMWTRDAEGTSKAGILRLAASPASVVPMAFPSSFKKAMSVIRVPPSGGTACAIRADVSARQRARAVRRVGLGVSAWQSHWHSCPCGDA